jgi:hypothetical protein
VLNQSDSNGFQNEDLFWLMLISTTVSKMVWEFGRRKNLEECNKITQEIISFSREHKFRSKWNLPQKY